MTSISLSSVSGLVQGSGFAVVGSVCGLGLVWVIDSLKERHLQKNYPHLDLKERIVKRGKTLFDKSYWTINFAIIGTVAGILITDRCHIPWTATLSGLAVGFKIGEYLWHRNRDRELISQFMEAIDPHHPQTIYNQVFLKEHLPMLRCMNVAELTSVGDRLREKNPNALIANFLESDLTDEDIQRFAQAGWFTKFYGFDLSGNLKLTHRSLQSIVKALPAEDSNNLEYLGLSSLGLTDHDLQLMAESGKFNRLTTLNISKNPRITGQGMAEIGRKGFKNLEVLDISSNPQLLTDAALNQWLQQPGFATVKGLSMQNMNLSGETLDRMIDQAEWFRNLKGLAVAYNVNLNFSSAIARLTRLADYIKNGCAGTGYRFYGKGLFPCCGINNFGSSSSHEVIALIKAGKASLDPIYTAWNPHSSRSRYRARSSNNSHS